MRKKKVPTYKHGVYRLFPIFWNHCIVCEYMFRFEKGWRFITGSWHGGVGVEKCVCARCAPNKDDAHQIAILYSNKPPGNQPPPPPPPPKRSLREGGGAAKEKREK